jgi:hypothetical protein
MIFISKPQPGGILYIAERSRKGYRRFMWSLGRAVIPSGTDIRIEASTVPYKIRRQAYRRLDPRKQNYVDIIQGPSHRRRNQQMA